MKRRAGEGDAPTFGLFLKCPAHVRRFSFWVGGRFKLAGKLTAWERLIHRLDVLGQLIGLGRPQGQAMLKILGQLKHGYLSGSGGCPQMGQRDVSLVAMIILQRSAATRNAHYGAPRLVLLCLPREPQSTGGR